VPILVERADRAEPVGGHMSGPAAVNVVTSAVIDGATTAGR
jgi:hypothetical protein